MHAWTEVYLPGAGWVGLDPTSGLFAGEGHIPIACSPEPSSAAPITGFTDESECEFTHTMKIERVWETPRVTKPYTDEQWADIESLGHRIDAELDAGDVRLTMGGEPTFISIDDPDGDEWNTDALGPTKRTRAADLFHRLREKYAPQGLAHFGQGKWYPGEQLPRWALNCFWRRDGQPLWRNPALIADETRDYGADEKLAGRFLRRVAERLDLASEYVFAAFEDAFYYLWRERRLPVNVDPFDSRLDDPLERERLARIFSQGMDTVVGPKTKIGDDSWIGFGNRLLIESKPTLPWYAPMPLAPTPPNGRPLIAKCSKVSLTVTPPAIVWPTIFSTVALSWLKGYRANGLSRPLMVAMASSNER